MSQGAPLKHQFVEFIPEELDEQTVYISVRFATVAHLCLCGCRNKVVTPLSPTDWQVTFDGKAISLYPSIGNWSFPCRSHYWIRKNRMSWAEDWSEERIEAGRARDRLIKERYFNSFGSEGSEPVDPEEIGVTEEATECKKPWWRKWWSR
jgi:hypothetical protein